MADAPSSGGGKIRSKRSTSSRKPYSRASSQRRSIFSRVTDSFKSLLNPITPRWLTNRLHHEEKSQPSPTMTGHSPSNPDNSVPSTSANHQQHHTNNNYKKSPLCRPPLSARPSSRSSLQYYITPPDSPSTEDASRPSTGGGKDELLKKLAMGSKRLKMSQEPVDGSDVSISRKEMDLLKVDDNASVASSSGCSSSVHASQRSTSADREGSQRNLWSSSAESLVSGRPSSFQQTTMTSSKRPRFNPAVFGVPAVGPPLRSQDAHLSSFYNGPIQFGGANSSTRQPYFATPYKIPSVTKVKVRHVNHQRTPGHSSRSSAESKSPRSDSSLGGISSTARKILQTLETMPSPLNDARRIPNVTRTPSTFLAARQRRRTLGSTSLLGSATKGPPTSSLVTPSSVKIRKRANVPLNNSLINRTAKRIATDESMSEAPSTSGPVPDSKVISTRGLPAPIASLSSTASLPKPKHDSHARIDPGAGGGGGGGKMKSQKRSSAHYSAMHEEVEEITPDLPKVALPLTSNLPSFNFGKSEMTSTPAIRPVERKAPLQPEFSFASPVVKTTKIEQAALASKDTPKFQFSSPQTKKSSTSSDQGTPMAATNFNAGSKPSTPSLVFAPDPKVVSALKSTKRKSSPLAAQESTGGFRPADNLKQGSVMDILNSRGKKTESPLTASKSPLQKDVLKPLTQSKAGWDCGTCLVSNDAGDVKCAACETPKPGSSSAKPAGDGKPWDCEVCLIPNDAGTVKCAACETPKPGSGPAKPQKLSGGLFAGSSLKSSSSSNFSFGLPSKPPQAAAEQKKVEQDKKSDSGWGNLAKKKTGTWDCGVCLVSNDASSDKCEACQTPKPGASANLRTDNNLPSKSSQFKFGISAAATSSSETKVLGWGSKASSKSATWECEVCMVPNSNERKTCEACESPKPGTEKKKPVLNTSFKFGENTSGLFKFGIPDGEAKKSEGPPEKKIEQEEKKEKTQQKINFGSIGVDNKSEPVKTTLPTLNFGAPAAKAAATEPPASADKPAPTFSFGVKTTEEPKKDESQSKPPALFSFGPPKTSDVAKPAFGAQSLNAFSTQKTESSTSSAAPATQPPPFGGSAPAISASGLSGFNPQFTGTAAQVSKPQSTASSLPVQTQSSAGGNGIFGGFNTNKTEDEKKPEPSKPAFSFGSAASKPSTGSGFQFSGSSTAPKPADSFPKPAFSFGAPQPPTQAANPASDKPTSVFGGFGTSQPPAAATQQDSNPPKPAFGGFNFTSSKTSTQSNSVGIFGSSSPAPNATPFGSSTNTASPFGAPAAKAPAFGSSTSSGSSNIFGAAPKPAFGTPSTQDANAGIPKPSFPPFGGSTNDSPAQKPAGGFSGFAFNSNSQQNNTGTPGGFAFGAPSKPAPAYPAPTFQFGGSQAQSAQSNGVFQFGSGANQAKNDPPPSENKSFVFGANNPAATGMAQQPASTGFAFGASAGGGGGGFNFTGSQPSTPQGSSMFGIAGEAAPSQNPFSTAGSRATTPVQGAGRRIRQARRKLRK